MRSQSGYCVLTGDWLKVLGLTNGHTCNTCLWRIDRKYALLCSDLSMLPYFTRFPRYRAKFPHKRVSRASRAGVHVCVGNANPRILVPLVLASPATKPISYCLYIGESFPSGALLSIMAGIPLCGLYPQHIM